MPLIYGELKAACLEVLSSDPTGPTQGRIWFNTTEGKIKFDAGSGIRALLRNDLVLVIGNSGTASQNVRMNRAGAGLLQLLPGNDVTAEGSLSTTLAQLSSRLENYLDASKPAFGNAGRLIYVTDLAELQFDTGSAWTTVGSGVDSGTNLGGFAEVFKDRVGTALRYRTLQSSDSSLTVTQNTNDIDIIKTTEPFHTQSFTSSGTFTAPAGVTEVLVFGIGGGGGGGGRATNQGGGAGGSSGQFYWTMIPVTPSNNYTVTIGAGGTGGTGASGSAGGNTSFDTTVFLGGLSGKTSVYSTTAGIITLMSPQGTTFQITDSGAGTPRAVGFNGTIDRGQCLFGGWSGVNHFTITGLNVGSEDGQDFGQYTGGTKGTTVGTVFTGGGGGAASPFGNGANGSNGNSGGAASSGSNASATSYGAGGGGQGGALSSGGKGGDGAGGYLLVTWVE